MANQVASAKCIVTIASPSSTERLANFLSESAPAIEQAGEGIVTIGGFQYVLRQQLLDDLRNVQVKKQLESLTRPILMFHSPQDNTLPYSWGLEMFNTVTSPKSFVTLDGSDHLLVERADDVDFVAEMIVAWSSRYLQ